MVAHLVNMACKAWISFGLAFCDKYVPYAVLRELTSTLSDFAFQESAHLLGVSARGIDAVQLL